MMRGARDYCNAYHGGVVAAGTHLKLLVANGVAPNAELLDRITWPARNPDGRLSRDFLTDVQRWYVKQGLARSELPLDQVLETRFAEQRTPRWGRSSWKIPPAQRRAAGAS